MDRLFSQKNILLVKDDVGKSKPPTFKLPQMDFSYGRPGDNKKQEGVAAITTSWKEHQ